ncbi:hypothetical protein PR048_020886 [Dryococelus australis]|uniref:Transposase n=1 Tax=Dryococelus australis TaxID=614101 RepID=A0ABQ9GWR6_9NEOP|nr:hypothetical protein PR048_020886 [Dryococelus australis]
MMASSMKFIPAGQTVNAAYYEQVLKRLLQCICHVRPELHTTAKWMQLHDDTPAHCAIHVHQFLAQCGVPVLSHPPYLPDLAPADSILFPHLKSILKSAHFATVQAIQCCVTLSSAKKELPGPYSADHVVVRQRQFSVDSNSHLDVLTHFQTFGGSTRSSSYMW